MTYKDFKAEDQADKWLDDNYSDWFDELSLNLNQEGSYQNALYGYGGSVSKHINMLLRAYKGRGTIEEHLSNSPIEPEFEESLRESLLINSAIDKVMIKDNIILYRYTKLTDVIRLIRNGSFKSIVENGFMSTTMLPDNESLKELILREKYDTLLRIEVPKGINGIPIRFPESNSKLKEYEFLLRPGHRMQVKGFSFDIKRRKFRFNVRIS